MAPLTWSQTPLEIRIAIWTQWLEGECEGGIARNFEGIVTRSGVTLTLKKDPPEDIVSDPRFSGRHRYLAIAADGMTNPVTEEPCLYVVLKLPERIGRHQLWKGIRIVRFRLSKVGGYLRDYGRWTGHIDEELFLEAGEAGIPAFQLDLLGNVTHVEFAPADDTHLPAP